MTAKQAALALIEKLPDEVGLDEILDKLILRQKIEDGLRDIEEGRTIPDEELTARLEQWRE